jgi:putative methylase
VRVKKKDLEIALAKVPGFKDPDASLEQYPTSAAIAADMLFNAYSNGDIEGMKVMDLGCGTGMLSLGAWMLGAGTVVGYDVDTNALAVAVECARSFGSDVVFREADVGEVDEKADTVVMNPPFGCQARRADRVFLDKAMSSADCIYSIHKAETLEFVTETATERGRRVIYNKVYKYEIPHTFSFHRDVKRTIDVVVVNIR